MPYFLKIPEGRSVQRSAWKYAALESLNGSRGEGGPVKALTHICDSHGNI